MDMHKLLNLHGAQIKEAIFLANGEKGIEEVNANLRFKKPNTIESKVTYSIKKNERLDFYDKGKGEN